MATPPPPLPPKSPSLSTTPAPAPPSSSPPKTPVLTSPAKPPVPMSRPAQPPKRKRRRSAPPPNVTSVFSPAHLPTSAQTLWTWPVFTWFFGAVNQTDAQIAAGNAFLDPSNYSDPSKLPPVATHYRLRWLEEDAQALVSENPNARIPLPEPLPSLKHVRVKETPACARQLPFAPSEEKPESDRKRRKRARTSSAAKLETPSVQNGKVELKAENVPPLEYRPPVKLNGPLNSAPLASQPTKGRVSFAVQPVHQQEPPRPTNGVKDETVLQEESHQVSLPSGGVGAVASVCAKEEPRQEGGALVPSPAISTLSLAMPLQNEDGSAPQTASVQRKEDVSMVDVDTGNDDGEMQHKVPNSASNGNGGYRQVRLQFLSPLEQQLMGTLTYSIPAPQEVSTGEGESVKVEGGPSTCEVHDNAVVGAGVMVEDMELEFRKSDTDFAVNFDDSDKTDELGPQVVQLSNTLSAMSETNRPIRNEAMLALQAEMLSQDSYSQMAAEEKRILERLKEIADEKQTQKAPAKTRSSSRRRSTSNRQRNATVPRPASRRQRVSRPTRKIREELDDEDMEPMPTQQEVEENKSSVPPTGPKPVPAAAGTDEQTMQGPTNVEGAQQRSPAGVAQVDPNSNKMTSEPDQIASCDLQITKMSPVTPCDQPDLPNCHEAKDTAATNLIPEPSKGGVLLPTAVLDRAANNQTPRPESNVPLDSVGNTSPSEYNVLTHAASSPPASCAETVLAPSTNGSESTVSNPSIPDEELKATSAENQQRKITEAYVGLPVASAAPTEAKKSSDDKQASGLDANTNFLLPLSGEMPTKQFASPVGIFPRESNETTQLDRVPSPVSPIQNATSSTFDNPLSLNLHLKPKNNISGGMVLSLHLHPRSRVLEKSSQ